MTPLQLAKQVCLNYKSDGSCRGMDCNKDLKQILLFKKLPDRCLLSDEQPCSYFESAILAGIPSISDEKKIDHYQEAEDEYEKMKEKHEQWNRFNQASVVGAGVRRIVRTQARTDTQADNITENANAENPGGIIRRIIRRTTQLDQIASTRRRIRR